MAEALPGLLGSESNAGAIMRAIQKRALRGLDPTKDQKDWLMQQEPRFSANADSVSDMLTPFPAIGEAVENPTLANVTWAGFRMADMASLPAALAILGGGYAAAGARDMGLLDMQAHAETRGQARARADAARAEGQAATEKAKAEAAILNAKTEAERQAALQRQAEADAALSRARKSGEQDEYNRAVAKAEGARDFELSRNRRFSDTEMGKMWDKTGGMAPLIAGGVLGSASRAATGGGKALYNYGLPAVLGGIAGATAPNLPLAYNAFYTEPDNPERRAYEAYSRELPPTHPRRQEWADYAKGLPLSNPVREAAAEELYNPIKAAERMLFGAIEGVGGGMLGADAVRIGSRMARVPGSLVESTAELPGRAMKGYNKGMTGAGNEKLLRDFTEIKNKIAEAKGFKLDAEADAALAAARARAGTAPPQPVAPPAAVESAPVASVAADTPAARARRYLNTY